MSTLLVFPWIERLGWALLHSLWQITVIALALGLLRLVFRRPGLQHALAMVSLLACVAWPTVTLVQSWPKPVRSMPQKATAISATSIRVESIDARALPSATLEVLSENQANTEAHRPFPFRALLNRAAPWAAGFWLSGLGLLLLRHAGALVVLHGLKRKAVSAASPALQSLFDQLKRRLGVHRAARLVVSAKVLTPMIIGTLRPVVLVPAALAMGLDPAQLEALLAHELAHLRRWDDLVNLVQCAIETLLFFHPAVWWISRRAREDRELCCDDLAVARGVERATLAQALGRLALWHLDAPQPVLAASGQGPVAARIQRLLQPSTPKFSACAGAWPLLLVLLAALPLAPLKLSHAEDNTKPSRGRILDRYGMVLAESDAEGLRHYPQKALAAHVIGCTGLVQPGKKALIGRNGIEQSCDKTLAAHDDVTLTLDADLQRSVEEILADKASGGGACVVMNPGTGEVLALASWPTYDLNRFVPSVPADEYNRLSKDPSVPLLGRAFQGSYFPASNFKLVAALAGLESGAIDAKTIFNGDPSFTIGDRTFRNWNKDSEGPLNITGAIKRSCNTWFYQAALKTGSGPMVAMAQDLGFGKPSGLPLNNEAKGFVPTDEFYMERYKTKIGPGILASIAIGQIVEASPMQVAVATGAIANGGTVLRPRLTTRQPAWMVSKNLSIDTRNMEAVRKGMLAAVNDEDGTGHNARIDGVQVAGKTGTAQWRIYEDSSRNRSLAWFTCFAPYEHPQVVVTLVYEGKAGERVSGGSNTAPIAKEILEKALQRSPPNPLPNAPDSADVGPLAERYNTAWFASATVEDYPVTDKLSGRLYLPLARALDPSGGARYERALLLTAGYALLYEGHVSVQRSKAIRIDSVSPLSATIDSDQFTKIGPEAWPSLWRTLWEQKRGPAPPSNKQSAASDEEPKGTKPPASVSAPRVTGAYKPETILMADGTTRGFVRGGTAIFPPSEVKLDPEPSQATFTPPSFDYQLNEKAPAQRAPGSDFRDALMDPSLLAPPRIRAMLEKFRQEMEEKYGTFKTGTAGEAPDAFRLLNQADATDPSTSPLPVPKP